MGVKGSKVYENVVLFFGPFVGLQHSQFSNFKIKLRWFRSLPDNFRDTNSVYDSGKWFLEFV